MGECFAINTTCFKCGDQVTIKAGHVPICSKCMGVKTITVGGTTKGNAKAKNQTTSP